MFGPDSTNVIDSNYPFSVEMVFYVDYDWEMTKVVTTITQNSNNAILTKNCTGALADLETMLGDYPNFSIVNKPLADTSYVSNETCPQ